MSGNGTYFLERNEENQILQKRFEQQKKEMKFTDLKQNNQIKSLNKELKLQTLKMQENQEKIHNGTLRKDIRNEFNKKTENKNSLLKEMILLGNKKPLQEEQNEVEAYQHIKPYPQQLNGDLAGDRIRVNFFHLK